MQYAYQFDYPDRDYEEDNKKKRKYKNEQEIENNLKNLQINSKKKKENYQNKYHKKDI